MNWCVCFLLVFLVLLGVADRTIGYPDGAPKSHKVCKNLKPHHEGYRAQDSSPPYSITPAKTKIPVGASVNVTISAHAGASYKGFLMQARPRMIANYIKPIGTFKILDASQSKTLDCLSASNNTVTHTNPSQKTSTSFIWTPPSNYKGNVYFRASFVKDFSTFWVNVSSTIVVGDTNSSDPMLIVPKFTEVGNYEVNSGIDQSQFVSREMYGKCGVSKACFGIPENCVLNGTCDVLAAVTARGSQFQFELMGENVKFIAVSLTENGQVNTESLMTCALVNNSVKFQQSTYYQHQSVEHMLNGSDALINSSFVDGILYCKFVTDETMEVNSVHYDLRNNRYFLALAAGNMEVGNENIDFNRIQFHISSKSNYLTDISGFSESVKEKSSLKEKYWYQSWFFGLIDYFLP